MEFFFVPIILIIIFGSVAAIILLPIWFRERTKQSAHHLIAQALEKGQQLDPALMEKLTTTVQANNSKNQSNARRTLGNGIVLLALGAGFFAASLMGNGWDPTGGFMNDGKVQVSLILIALGSAFTILALVDYASKKKQGP